MNPFPSGEWKPFTWDGHIEKGSVLDFSAHLDGPAGKYGRLMVKNGKFVFEKNTDKPVRFYGINLSFAANFLEKEACRKMTDRLATCGYNSIRIHHHDRILTSRMGNRCVDLDPVEMDKLDYLFHCCKERGLYVTTDLYVSRMPQQIFPELGRPVRGFEEFKFLIHLLDDARKNWEDFSRNFLEHVNPYTGLAWKEDPALITLSMVNEDAIFHCYKNATSDIKRIYDTRFEGWLKERGIKEAAAERRLALLNLFLFETCRASFAQMRGFVRSLGCQTLLTDQNHWSILPMALLREPCEFVDDHFYHDHPEKFALPSKLANNSALSDLTSIFSGIMPGRVFGKPYTCSEFNWVYPNQFRAESGVVTGAYAGLQDWDALYRYTYAHSSAAADREAPAGYFDVSSDPVNSLSERIAMLLFLRGDVQKSSLQFPIVVSSGHMEQPMPVNTYPGQAWKLCLVGQIGTVVGGNGSLVLPANARACITVGDGLALSAGQTQVPRIETESDAERMAMLEKFYDWGRGKLDLENGFACSSTGEIEIDEKRLTLKVVTPNSEALVFCDKGRLAGAALTAENHEGSAVVFAATLDGNTLGKSQRILLMHLTDVRHHDMKFVDDIIENWGSQPYLLRLGKVTVSLQLDSNSLTPTVWALDLSGRRTGERKSSFSAAGIMSFQADTFETETPCLLYEVVCQSR